MNTTKRIATFLAAVGVTASTCLGSVAPVLAQAAQRPAQGNQPNPANSGQALEIAPPVITLTANPGQIIKTQISLRDISSGNLLVRATANDFIAAGEDGTPKILLEEQGNNPYSLKDWVAPIPEMLMIPRQIKSLPVTINVPANASPGGHYGVIRFTATPPELKDSGVSLSASLGSLLLVTVNGKTTEKLEVEEFSVNHKGKKGTFFESAPVGFQERIKNIGNVHQQPTGQVSITNMFGKKIAAVNINLPPRNILPGSIRKFEQPLDKSVLGNTKLFGRYTAALKLNYGSPGQAKQVVESSIVFWIVPYKLIGAIIIVLIGGFFALRAGLRRYNRRIISQAQNGNSSVSKRKKPKK